MPQKVESGFDMAKDSMSFANFATGYEAATLNAEAMQRMFGPSVCRNQASPCELTLAANAFMNKANKSMLGGRCEGFAVLSSMLQAGKVKGSDFGGESARDLVLAGNEPLQRELAYWFATQLHPLVVENTKGYMAKDVMPKLAEALAKDAKERFRIGIVKKNGDRVTGGHALTPIAYYPGESEGVYLLRVYDNNIPDTVRTVRIDTKNNRWEYEASENPQKRSSLYYGDATNKNPLYFAPIFTRAGELECHFCSGDKVQVTTSGGAQVVVNGTGVENGEAKSSGSGQVSPTFTATNDTDGAQYNVIVENSGSFDVSIAEGDDGNSTDGASAGLEMTGSNFSASLAGLDLQGSVNQWSVGNEGRRQAFTNESHSPVVIGQQIENGNKIVTVSATLQGSSNSVASEIQSDGKIRLETTGTMGTMVTVAVTVTNGEGVTSSGTLSYMAQGDSTLSTDAHELEMTGSATGSVDNNGTMQTLGNACEDGKRSGTESDIDCGGTCSQKCAEGLQCNSGADCASTFCSALSKVCVAEHCADQAKTSDESDVDCGGSCTAKCALNRACGTSLDCAAGLVCDGSVCKNSYVLSASVTGLSVGANVTLTNATNGDVLTLSANDVQAFASRVVSAYDVSVTQQPGNGVCTVASGSGTASADVTLTVTCIRTYAVGGSLTGLNAGNSLVIVNNSGDAQTLTADGPFVFATRVTGAYSVTVQTQPTLQLCTIASGTGTATQDVGDVSITCGPAGYSIGGVLSGLAVGQSVVLQNNGADNLTLSADGSFTFATVATAYSVTVSTQPTNGSCTVANASGTATSPVTSVQVTCVASGVLDTTFGSGGFLYEARTGRNEWFKGVVNPDNSSVWVGRDSIGAVSNQDMVISKVTATGAFDTSFGASGHLYLSRGVDSERALAVHRLSDGSYLFAGEAQGSASKDFTVGRVTPAGALDTTFGSGGLVQIDSGGNAEDLLADMVVRANGSILLVGTTGTGANANITIMALTSTGALDTTFGSGGIVTYGSAGVADIATAIDYSPSTGHIMVVGTTGSDSLMLRFSSTGTPDASFGTAGVLSVDFGAGQADGLNALLMTGSGVVVAGYVNNGADDDMLVASYTATGAPDTGFGTAGVVKLNRGAADVVRQLVAAPSGGYYVAGASGNKMSVGLLQSNGVPRSSFGVMGFFESPLAASFATAGDILIDNAGRLLVGGAITDAAVNPDFGVARLLP